MFKVNWKTVGIIVIAVLAVMYLCGSFSMENYRPMPLNAEMPINADLEDLDNLDAYGTRTEPRWENMTRRSEYCGKPGHTHVCKCGYASKRVVDGMASNHMLPHVCRPCDGRVEPSEINSWWVRADCTDSERVGVNIRPTCTDCGV